jgi:hypothetical protein
MRLFAILLIVAGILGLVYGGFTYTTEDQEAKIGPVEFVVKKNKTVNIPVWVGIGTIVLGGILLVGSRRG